MPCGHHLLQRSHNPNCMVSHLLKGSYIYVHKIQPELAWVYASVKAMVGAVRWEGNSFKCHDGTVSSIPKDTFANRDALIEIGDKVDVLWGRGGRLWHSIVVAPLKPGHCGSKTSNHERHPSKVGKAAKSSAMTLQTKLDGARFCDDLAPEQEMSTILQGT